MSKKVTAKNFVVFAVAHLAASIFLNFFSYDELGFFTALADVLGEKYPAFNTLFVHSNNPVGCKLLLLLWWLVLLPWGFLLTMRFVSQIERDKNAVNKTVPPENAAFFFLFQITLALYVVWSNSFKEHSIVVPANITRNEIQYILLSGGAIGATQYLITSSLAVVGFGSGAILMFKYLIRYCRS